MDGTFRMFSFSFCFHIGADKIWLIYGFYLFVFKKIQ